MLDSIDGWLDENVAADWSSIKTRSYDFITRRSRPSRNRKT